MSEFSRPLDPASFAEHAAFVRRLARRLESDESEAEDLVQETWLAALMRAPDPKRLRAWLASVLRNKSVEKHRARGRRVAHENERRRAQREHETGRGASAGARSAGHEDAAELAERMELQQLAVQAVLELPEAYREVLLYRFASEEDVSTIARRLELPEATVRTRLRRGLERLRQRLTGEMGGTSALFAISLKKLSGESLLSPPMAGASAAAAGTGLPPWIALFIMKKLSVVAALVIAAAALLWSIQPAEPTPGHVTAQQTERPAADDSPALLEADLARIEAPASRAQPAPAAEPAREEPSPAKGEVKDDDPNIGRILVRVVDAFGSPIAQAKLYANYWRSKEDPYSTSAWGASRDAGYMGESGPDGVVQLRYPRQLDGGDVGPRTLSTIGFEVSHPDYKTHSEPGLDVSKGETVIVLERGSFLVVSGWIHSPDEMIADVKPRLSFGADVSSKDWLPVRNGRPSCGRIPAGTHSIYLSHADGAGDTWYSEVHTFTLEAGEQKELALQLHPPILMKGVLDPAVPRPIENGEVELNLFVNGAAPGNVLFRTFRAPIAMDGSFEVASLPPGAGEIIGLCDGWASSEVVALEPGGPGADSGANARASSLQQLNPAEHVEAPFVLAMEPTGSVQVVVTDPSGAPVEGATIYGSPNVRWTGGFSDLFIQRTPRATTDAEGKATLEHLPSQEGMPISIRTSEGYRLPRKTPEAESSRRLSATVVSGETVELEVQLDPPSASSDD